MGSDRALRLKAGFALAKALGSTETRALFAEYNYSSGDVVVVLETDKIQDVYARFQRYAPPILLAIYWPEQDRLTYTQMEPSAQSEGYSPEKDDVAGGSTIGMLWQHANRQNDSRFRFRLAWSNASVHVVPFQLASK